MIYWLQEATQAGAQGAASLWPSAILSGGLVGAVVGLIGVLLAQRRHSQTLRQTAQLEAQRAHEAALQKYFEQVGKLLVDKPMHNASPGDNLSTVVRAQTLAVLEGLDPTRKRILLEFLKESNLITTAKPIISLGGANLRNAELIWSDLSETNLSKTVLSWAALFDADLSRANLSEANLFGADLGRAVLIEADLRGAKLSPYYLSKLSDPPQPGKLALFVSGLKEAFLYRTDRNRTDLLGADLSRANLGGADLRDTDLLGARLTEAHLRDTDLRGANLRYANLSEANLFGANLRLSKWLTQEQIDSANGDEHTLLPDHLQRPAHWSKAESEES